MKDALIKHAHWLIIFYAAFNLYELYEKKLGEVEGSNASFASKKSRLQRNESELKRVKKFNEDLEKSQRRVDEVIKNLEKIQKQLPAEINDTEIQSLMNDFSNQLRIQSPETSPKGEQAMDFYFSKDYLFDAKGTFLQFLILFEKLEKLSDGENAGRILNVKYVRLVEDETADSRSRFRILKLALTIESFRYNSAYKWKE